MPAKWDWNHRSKQSEAIGEHNLVRTAVSMVVVLIVAPSLGIGDDAAGMGLIPAPGPL